MEGELTVAAPSLGADIPIRYMAFGRRAKAVLVAHDGPEYASRAGLAGVLGQWVSAGRIPPLKLVLVSPVMGRRNEWYAANPGYTEALVGAVLPAVRRRLRVRAPVVGMGASLGAVAMLHAQRTAPAEFAGLFLQSGSFFLPRFDPQERDFEQYRQIIRFVGGAMRIPGTPVAATLTCGLDEENLANNRCMAHALRAQGYPLEFVQKRGGHGWDTWHNAFEPHLADLLARAWRDA
jgi:enterochelin esterase-like enzyme